MKPFKHYTASSLEEASRFLTQEGRSARLVAGGTDLLGGLKDSIHKSGPQALIDLKRIPGLDGMTQTKAGLSLGAAVSLHRLEMDPVVKEKYPLLAQAARAVASPQIRNMGTLGGNICQEPRCWYYRYPDDFFHCLRKGGDLCPAFIGENRFHSIFGGAKVGTTPCTQACPASTDIPAYLELFRAGRVDEAAAKIMEVNPLAPITGRVCPHFCQEECNRNELDGSVSIRSMERFLGDHILDNADKFYAPPEKELEASVGILGAGPAGLAAAFFLRRAGLKVTLYDRMAEPGGMLRYAIPAYRLPREILARLVKALEGMGVSFELGREVSDQAGLEELAAGHQAFFAATGAWGQPRINIEGEDKALSGLEFLTRAAQGEPGPVGPRVVVIGGGNVAIDVGLTAKRLGAASVVLACLEEREEMPAHDWEIAQAEDEGLTLRPGWGPSQIAETKDGLRIGLVRCTSVFDDQGGFCPSFDDSSTDSLEADQVFLAVGQRVETGHLDPGLLNKRGLASVNAFTQATGKEGFFAGGDLVTGPASVIGAVASGGRAAGAILEKLGAAPERPAAIGGGSLGFAVGCTEGSAPAAETRLDPGQRALDQEDEATIGPDLAAREAGRCFNCGCVAVSPADIPPALIALGATVATTERRIPAREFFSVAVAGSTVLDEGEIVVGVELPAESAGLGWGFEKFRIRKAIDFPIASAAVVLRMEEGRATLARVVLGAVAPIPLRSRAAEEKLIGREVNETSAQEAARAAIAQALPLAENGYKVQVIEALITRAILSAARRSGKP